MSRVLRNKPEFSKEELLSLEKAFRLFADRNGIVNLNNMVIAMKELKFDESEPVIFDLMAELETEVQHGLTYDEFIDKLTEKLGDRESQRATERVYELFVKDPKGTLNYEALKNVATEIGDQTPDEELQRLIKNGASNGTDIPYEEFHSIMTKDISLKYFNARRNKLSGGAIVAIVICSLIALVAIIILIYLFKANKIKNLPAEDSSVNKIAEFSIQNN